MIIVLLLISVVLIVLSNVKLFKNNVFRMTLGKIQQINAGEQVSTMSISGKVITKNIVGQYYSTVELYKKENGDKVLIESKTTELDGSFSFTITQIGQYDVIIKKQGYLTCKKEDIEITNGDNIIFEDINLKAGDINSDGEVELSDLIKLNEYFGDITGESIPQGIKIMDFNEDGWINQLDKTSVKEGYSVKEVTQSIPVQEVVNDTFEVQISEIKDVSVRSYYQFEWNINITKDIEINNDFGVYFIDTNNNPNGDSSYSPEGYELQEGESIVAYGNINKDYETNQWMISVYFNRETINPKMVIPAGYMKRGDVVSEFMSIDCGLIVDGTSPVIESNEDTIVTETEQGKTLEIPIKITDVTGIEGFEVDDLEVYSDSINCSKYKRTLTFISEENSEDGKSKEYNYILKIENIVTPGVITIETKSQSFVDKAGNTVNKIIITPKKSEEQITVVVENIASITDNDVTINYTSINDAVDACQVGQTIKLLSDCSEAIFISNQKDIILDLNGHIISNANNNTTLLNEGKVVIIDSVGDGIITNRKTTTIDNRNEMTTNIDIYSEISCTFSNSNYAILNIEGGIIESPNIIVAYNFGVLNLKGGKIQNTNVNGSDEIKGIYNTKIINMTGGEISIKNRNASAIYSVASETVTPEINITGGSVKAFRNDNSSYNDYNRSINTYASSSKYYTIINIGTHDGIVNKEEPYIVGGIFSNYVKTYIYDGLFRDAVPSYKGVEEGYKLYSYYSSEGNRNIATSYLIPETAMVFIDDGNQKNYYSSLEEALAVCPENASDPTIITYADNYYQSNDEVCKCQEVDGKIQHTCAVVIPSNKKVIIDYNGKTVDMQRGILFSNNGYLKLTNSSSNTSSIRSYSTSEYDENYNNIIDHNYFIENNGTLEIDSCSVCSTYGEGILNNGILKINNARISCSNSCVIENNGSVICNLSEISSENNYESIINRGTIQYNSGNVYGKILNEVNSTLTIGSLEEGSLINEPYIYANSNGCAIENKGVLNYYGGKLGQDDSPCYIDGEITSIREGYRYTNGHIVPIESKVQVFNGTNYTFFITLEDALEETYKNMNTSYTITLLGDINEQVIIKYIPNQYSSKYIRLNGFTISGENTTIINNNNSSLYIYGPGKIISTNGTAIENNKSMYVEDNNYGMEIIGKDYAIKNNNSASLNINAKNISANIGIYNEGYCNITQKTLYNGNYSENIITNIVGIEKGIENVNGNLNIYNCNISGNIGVDFNSEYNSFYINDEVTITGVQIGIKSSKDINVYGNVIIKGLDAVEGNDIITSSNTKTITSTVDGIEIIKVAEAVAPEIYVSVMNNKYKVSNNEEVELRIELYDNGKPVDSLTIDELTFKINGIEIEPIKKELIYDAESSGGNTIYYKLILKFNLQDETLNEKSVQVEIKENAVYDTQENYSTATTLSPNVSIYMYEAKIGDEKYVTLQDAVAAVPDGVETEIILLKCPTNPSITVLEGKILSLDSQSNNMVDITVNGTLKLTSKTQVNNIYASESSTVDAEGGYVQSASVFGTLILNGGDIRNLTIEKGEVTNKGTFSMNLIVKSGATYIQDGNSHAYVNGTSKIYGTAQIKTSWLQNITLYSSGELIVGTKDGEYIENSSIKLEAVISKIEENSMIKLYDGIIRGNAINDSKLSYIVDIETGYDKICIKPENDSYFNIKLVLHAD